ncbi:MAG: outer membrane protein assembly factor BamE [Proteobacteria bacterium]|nr:outer membrane protein assembly factor BamE [Pseudomonadota bacterium]
MHNDNKMLIALGMTLMLSACAETLTTHGQVIRESQLQELKVGQTTREDVMVNLGSPSSKAVFDEDRWIYITSLTKSEPLKPNQLEERTVITLTFNKEGVLQGMDVRNKNDGKPIVLNNRVTPTQGQSLGIVDQLMENLGKGF